MVPCFLYEHGNRRNTMEEDDILTLEGAYEARQEGFLSRSALQALRRIPHLVVSPLSPLAHLEPKAERDDPAALLRTWQQEHEVWTWAMPALMNPHRAITLLMGDTDTAVLGQYLWEDPYGLMPGIRVGIEPEQIAVEGPILPETVLMGLLETLHLSGMRETEPIRIQLSKRAFWTVMTLLDAYRMALLKNRLLRKGGFPKGVSLRLLQEAWVLGCSQKDLGWAVTMYASLLPDDVPPNFEAALPQALVELSEAGLLSVLNPEDGREDEPIYVFDEALEVFFQTLVPSSMLFGLVVQTIQQPEQVAYSVLGGWRSSSGIWLADFAEFATGSVELMFVGSHFLHTALETLIITDSLTTNVQPYSPDQRYHPDVLARALMDTRKTINPTPVVTIPVNPAFGEVQVSVSDHPPVAEQSCSTCGHPLAPDARFCAQCGMAVQEVAVAVPTCPACGTALREGVRFCTKCGMAVQ